MDKVAGLLNGPVGSLLGAGLQAVANRSSPDCGSRCCGAMTPMDSEHQRIMNFYGNVGAHLHGAINVLKPALVIRDMIVDNQRCKSAEPLLAKPQETQIPYYTPQKNRSGCQCNGNRMTSNTESTSRSSKSTSKSVQSDTLCGRKKIKREPMTESTFSDFHSLNEDPRRASTLLSHSCSKSSKSSCDSSRKSSKSSKGNDRMKNCSKCGIGIDKVRILSVISCGHVFCGSCIAKDNFNHCPICKKRINSANVTRISNYSFD